jgi:selenocysteine-specific elongation factor
VIIGTAGHIDHGKSALVTALTGRPVDRLAEERRREITIELNFAPLDLGHGRIAGMIDVPGHEDFIRTMVAGASGIDLALLVVAADEGIMPQTEEHLTILEQLGVTAGLPIITKTDLAGADWLELVTAELMERLARSPIAFGAPMAVSARTGKGIGELRDRLREIAGSLPFSSPPDAFRMPIDRTFSLAGVGTVVTGTSWSGRLRVGDTAVIFPAGLRGRVRSLESYGEGVERSLPRGRTAVGIAGIDRHAIRRGDVLVTDDLPWRSTSALDVEISLVPGAPRLLTSRSRVRLHLGTAEIMARVLPQAPIPPGGRGVARLKLDRPTLARAEDRFVLRSYSPVTTIGGGRVLDPTPPRRRSVWPAGISSTDPAQRLAAALLRHHEGISTGSLPIVLGLPRAAAGEVARNLSGSRLLEDTWVRQESIEDAGSRALSVLREYHRQHISQPGMPLETLRHSMGVGHLVGEAALNDSIRAGRVRRIDGVVALAGFVPRVVGGDPEIERVVGLLQEANLTPPSVAELERSSGRRDVLAVLRLAAARGQVEAVERDRYYTRQALEQFTSVLTELGQEGEIVPSVLRDRLGITRKYLIPLLEWADGKGITVRVGEGRRLRGSRA